MQFSDRVQIETRLFHLYGPYRTRKTSFAPVKREIYSKSTFNEMQFSDRVRIESGPFHLFGLYGLTTRETP